MQPLGGQTSQRDPSQPSSSSTHGLDDAAAAANLGAQEVLGRMRKHLDDMMDDEHVIWSIAHTGRDPLETAILGRTVLGHTEGSSAGSVIPVHTNTDTHHNDDTDAHQHEDPEDDDPCAGAERPRSSTA